MRKFILAFSRIQNEQINPSNPSNPGNDGNDSSNDDGNSGNESIVNQNIISYEVTFNSDDNIKKTCIGKYTKDITNLDLNNIDSISIHGDSQWCEVMKADGNIELKRYDSLSEDEKHNICGVIESPSIQYVHYVGVWFLYGIQGYDAAQVKGSINDLKNLDKLAWVPTSDISNFSIVKLS